MKHLWEIKHSYCLLTVNGINKYASFTEFKEEFKYKESQTLLIRWDWTEEDDEEDNNFRCGKLILTFLQQNRGKCFIYEIEVYRGIEAMIIEFLTPYWKHMKELWEPISNDYDLPRF